MVGPRVECVPVGYRKGQMVERTAGGLPGAGRIGGQYDDDPGRRVAEGDVADDGIGPEGLESEGGGVPLGAGIHVRHPQLGVGQPGHRADGRRGRVGSGHPHRGPSVGPGGGVGSSGESGTTTAGASVPPSISNTLPVTHDEASDAR